MDLLYSFFLPLFIRDGTFVIRDRCWDIVRTHNALRIMYETLCINILIPDANTLYENSCLPNLAANRERQALPPPRVPDLCLQIAVFFSSVQSLSLLRVFYFKVDSRLVSPLCILSSLISAFCIRSR